MTTRPVHDRVEDLLDELAAATSWRLEPIGKHVDSLSGSPFELATVGDDRYLVKHLSRDLDWIMRNLGDGVDGRRPWALIAWQDGLLDALPDKIDHLIVGMAYDGSSGHLRQVMRYEPQTLVPSGHDAVPHAQHRRFLDHMAALHAAFWGFVDTYGLLTPVRRYAFADPRFTAREAAAGHSDAVPRLFPQGWESVRQVAPRSAALALTIVADATRLERAMADGPRTFVHGDWKLGNLGVAPRRAHRTSGLGLAGRGQPLRRPRLVPRGQLRPAAGVQRGHDRRVPLVPGAMGYRHRGLVGPSARPGAARGLRPAGLVQDR